MRKFFFLSLLFIFIATSFSKDLVAKVLLIKLEGAITPVTEEFFMTALQKALEDRAQALVVELDTPGGLVESARKMVKAILQSSVPVIVYVAPSGARAASAGTFLLLSAHIAAMAPGTHTGAAHPLALMGKMDNKTLEKVTNDLIAWAKNLAELRGRNPKFAKEAIVKSKSITEKEALKIGVINFIAKDLNEVFIKASGKKVKLPHRELVLNLKRAKVEKFKENFKIKLLKVLTNPNMIYFLLLLGLTGLYFELSHPGGIFPGVVGAISLILSLVGLSVLPINYAGLALILLAGLLFFLETQITSHGLLTIGGVISLFLGSVMLFKTAPSGLGINPSFLYTVASFFAIVFGSITYLAVKTLRKPPVSGKEGLMGKVGKALEDFEKEGMIFVEGEIWKAVTESQVNKGEKVIVIGKDGLTLRVKPLKF